MTQEDKKNEIITILMEFCNDYDEDENTVHYGIDDENEYWQGFRLNADELPSRLSEVFYEDSLGLMFLFVENGSRFSTGYAWEDIDEVIQNDLHVRFMKLDEDTL